MRLNFESAVLLLCAIFALREEKVKLCGFFAIQTRFTFANGRDYAKGFDTAGRTRRFVKIVEMAEANPMICPDCGVAMNHHANKVRKETHPDDVSAFDSELGGVIEEFHTCPQCGKTQSRRAPHSEKC